MTQKIQQQPDSQAFDNTVRAAKLGAVAIGALFGAAMLAGCAGVVSPSSQQHRPQPPQAQQGTLAATPNSENFGSVAVGSTATQTIVVINQGPGAVQITAASASGSGFTLQPPTLPMSLAAGASASLSATFAPTAAQAASGSIAITSNAADSSLSIALSGQGTAVSKVLAATPNQVSFGNVLLGQSSSATVALANQGNAAVTISGISGAGNGFVIGGMTGTTLAPGQSTNMSVTFTPSVAGTASDTLAVNSDAMSPVAIGLSGIGVVVSGHTVALTWQTEDGNGDAVTGYNVYRQDSADGQFVKINSAPLAAVTFEDSNTASGNTYAYAVTAVNADGVEGPQSDPAFATIP